MNKIKLLIIVLYFSTIAGIEFSYSGNVLFGTINRVNDGSLIKVPFRFTQINPILNMDYFDIVTKFAFEINLKDDFSNTEYFLDTRELYINFYPPFGDIRIGKQIHSWGSLTNNNPTDNLNPINYYYIFSRGTERKEGVFSLAIDSYFGENKLGLILIPGHHSNIIPLNDNQLPIKINGLREGMHLKDVNVPHEYGIMFKRSFSDIDFTLSYLSGHDRTMSPFGANVWVNSVDKSLETAFIDTVLGFRDTDVYGIGMSSFIGNLSIRSELAYFITNDMITKSSDIYRTLGSINKSSLIVCESVYDNYANLPISIPEEFWPECDAELVDTLGVGTKAEYYQYVVEFEYPFIFDIDLSGQIFFYNLLTISGGLTPLIEAQVDLNLLPEDNFIPGMGAPLSLFTITETSYNTISMNKARTIFINAKRIFYDLGLELNLRTYVDLLNKGRLVEFESIYDLNDKLKINSAINFISGNSDLSNSYLFNPMEDFSHIRIEMRYLF